MPDRRAERRATRTAAGGGGGDHRRAEEEDEVEEEVEAKRGGYVRVSPCIILRSFEKAKATAGCVTLAALPMGA